jgi:hypothetical protein
LGNYFFEISSEIPDRRINLRERNLHIFSLSPGCAGLGAFPAPSCLPAK